MTRAMTVLREKTPREVGAQFPQPGPVSLLISSCSLSHTGLVPPGPRHQAQVRGLSSRSPLGPKPGWAPGSWAGGASLLQRVGTAHLHRAGPPTTFLARVKREEPFPSLVL